MRTGDPVPHCSPFFFPSDLLFFLRALCLEHVTYDYRDFLSGWASFFGKTAAGRQWRAKGNYNVPYLYFLAAISYLPVRDLYRIKLFSILFDVLLAWGGYRLVRRLSVRAVTAPVPPSVFLLLLPTVVSTVPIGPSVTPPTARCASMPSSLLPDRRPAGVRGSAGAGLLLQASDRLSHAVVGRTVVCWTGTVPGPAPFPRHLCPHHRPRSFLGKPLGDILGVYFGQAAESATI